MPFIRDPRNFILTQIGLFIGISLVWQGIAINLLVFPYGWLLIGPGLVSVFWGLSHYTDSVILGTYQRRWGWSFIFGWRRSLFGLGFLASVFYAIALTVIPIFTLAPYAKQWHAQMLIHDQPSKQTTAFAVQCKTVFLDHRIEFDYADGDGFSYVERGLGTAELCAQIQASDGQRISFPVTYLAAEPYITLLDDSVRVRSNFPPLLAALYWAGIWLVALIGGGCIVVAAWVVNILFGRNIVVQQA